MACSGCNDRGEAMRDAMIALGQGDLSEVNRQLEKFNQATANDVRNAAGALRDAARARLGIRR